MWCLILAKTNYATQTDMSDLSCSHKHSTMTKLQLTKWHNKVQYSNYSLIKHNYITTFELMEAILADCLSGVEVRTVNSSALDNLVVVTVSVVAFFISTSGSTTLMVSGSLTGDSGSRSGFGFFARLGLFFRLYDLPWLLDLPRLLDRLNASILW